MIIIVEKPVNKVKTVKPHEMKQGQTGVIVGTNQLVIKDDSEYLLYLGGNDSGYAHYVGDGFCNEDIELVDLSVSRE